MTSVRTGATPARLALAARVAELRSRGLTHKEVAVELDISRSYASTLADDPDGSLSAARKDSYAGKCAVCGMPTTGSNGRNQAPARCQTCEAKHLHDNAQWTRETIVDAIQRFAAVHGRPPIADEWIRSDQAHGYPPRSAVYGRGGHSFPTWGDAIEAAGFERPTSGRRVAMTQARGGYTVLQETEPGVWKEIGLYEAGAQILALNQALNGHAPDGRWVAVPGRYWEPRALRPKTIYEFVSAGDAA